MSYKKDKNYDTKNKINDKYFKFSFEKCLRNYETIPTPIWEKKPLKKLDYF